MAKTTKHFVPTEEWAYLDHSELGVVQYEFPEVAWVALMKTQMLVKNSLGDILWPVEAENVARAYVESGCYDY